MNRPCIAHFHYDDAPRVIDLPERYHDYVIRDDWDKPFEEQIALAVSLGHAFYIDFAPNVLRTRVGGNKEEDPVDFPMSSISFIEWDYSRKV